MKPSLVVTDETDAVLQTDLDDMFDNVEVYLPIHEGTCVSPATINTFNSNKNNNHNLLPIESSTSSNFTKSSSSVMLSKSRHQTTLSFVPGSTQALAPEVSNKSNPPLPPLHVVCMNHKNNCSNNINNNNNTTNKLATPNSATTTSSFFNSSRQSFSSCISSLSLAECSNTSSMRNSSINQESSCEKVRQSEQVISQSESKINKSGSVTSLMYKNIPISRKTIDIDKVLTGLELTLEQKTAQNQLFSQRFAKSSSYYMASGSPNLKLCPMGSQLPLASKMCVNELNIDRIKAKSCSNLIED